MPDPDANLTGDTPEHAGHKADSSRFPTNTCEDGSQGFTDQDPKLSEAVASDSGAKRDGTVQGRSVVIRLDQNEVQEYPLSPSASVEQESGESEEHRAMNSSIHGAQGWNFNLETALGRESHEPGSAEMSSTAVALQSTTDDAQGEQVESMMLQSQIPRSQNIPDTLSLEFVGSDEHIVHPEVERGAEVEEQGREQSLRRGSIKRARQEISPDSAEDHPIEHGAERQEPSGMSERLRTVTFTQPGSDDTSPRSLVSSGRLRTLSDTLAPRNMPYLDSGEDWESEEDARSSRSGRNSIALRGRGRLSQTTWDSEEGTDSEREASSSPLQPSSGPSTSMTAQGLEVLSAELTGVIDNLKIVWTHCSQLEAQLEEGRLKYEDLNQLSENGSDSRAHTGEAELLFTVLHGISARKVAVDEAVNTSLLLARHALGHSTNGVQRLARESMELQETVGDLQNQLNSKNTELMEAKESLKAMNEDKEDLHEAVEQLQQLLQCSDDELEALREENEELHQQAYMQRNKIPDLGTSSSSEVQCKNSGGSDKEEEPSQPATAPSAPDSTSTLEQDTKGAGLFPQPCYDQVPGVQGASPPCTPHNSELPGSGTGGSGNEPNQPAADVPFTACAQSGCSTTPPPQDIGEDVKEDSLGRNIENAKELDSRLNEASCAETVQVSIKVQPAQDELEDLHKHLGIVQREKEQLSEALQEASNRYLKEIEQLQMEKGEWCQYRDQLEILEAENRQLRLVVAELDKAHRKITRMRVQLEEQAELNQNVLANHTVLVQRLDELSERLKSRDAHMGDTLDAAREVGRENLRLQEQILELKMRILSEQAEKDRLEGELRQLLNRISEKQSSNTWGSHSHLQDTKALLHESNSQNCKKDWASSHSPQKECTEKDTNVCFLSSQPAQTHSTNIHELVGQEALQVARMAGTDHYLAVHRGNNGDIPESSGVRPSCAGRSVDLNPIDQKVGKNEEYPLPQASFMNTQSTSLDNQDTNVPQSCQGEILNLLRERLEQVDTERKKDANNAHIKLSEEKESREKAEYLLREGSQLMQSLVTTIQLCLRVAKGDNMLGGCTASQREKDTLDAVIRAVSNLETVHEDQARKLSAPFCSLLGSSESGMGPAQLE